MGSHTTKTALCGAAGPTSRKDGETWGTPVPDSRGMCLYMPLGSVDAASFLIVASAVSFSAPSLAR